MTICRHVLFKIEGYTYNSISEQHLLLAKYINII